MIAELLYKIISLGTDEKMIAIAVIISLIAVTSYAIFMGYKRSRPKYMEINFTRSLLNKKFNFQ